MPSAFNGTFAFDRDANNPLDSGYSFSNALLGSVASYTESNRHPFVHARDNSIEWYGQDSLKVNRRLTLEAGARFYWIDPSSSASTQLAAFDSSLYSAGSQPPLIQPFVDPSTRARVGLDPVTKVILPAVSIGAFSTASGTPNQAMRLFQEKVLNRPGIQFAPRVGFAWDIFGNAKTAFRGGFGVFLDRFPQNQIGLLVTNPPVVITPVTYYTSIANLLSSPLNLSPSTVYGIQRDFKPVSVYNWSFGIQQNVGLGMVLDVAYVGDVSKHGMQTRNLNATPYGTNFLAASIDATVNRPLPVNFLRPVKGYGDILYMEFASNSNYHALQTQLTRRLGARLALHASYTWSKVLDVADTVTSVVNPVLDYRSRNYGPAGFDRRQNLALNYVYNLPAFGERGHPVFRLLLNDWAISGISSFISGAPLPINYSFVTATDVTGAAGAGIDSRVDLTCNPVLPHDERTFYRAFNTTCVQAPARSGLGIGNASKFPFTGPGVENFDVSLFKSFRLGASDARRVQFRLETYNSWNHAQFTAVDVNARFDARGAQVNQGFGQYTATSASRRAVLGVKLYF